MLRLFHFISFHSDYINLKSINVYIVGVMGPRIVGKTSYRYICRLFLMPISMVFGGYQFRPLQKLLLIVGFQRLS